MPTSKRRALTPLHKIVEAVVVVVAVAVAAVLQFPQHPLTQAACNAP
jgi:hypothetical protein